jgi:signal transduction histidine kinase
VWKARVQAEIEPAKDLPTPIIVNTLPALLENLIEVLDPEHPRSTASDHSSLAVEHGSERARITQYSPGEIIKEYQVLRNVLFDELAKAAPTAAESATINHSIDQAMMASLNGYFQAFLAFREQFTLTLTHDLRNPLSAILTDAELILRKPANSAGHVKHAGRILSNVQRIDRMIQDLLDASRVRLGERLPLQLAEGDFFDVVQETLEQLSATYKHPIELVGKPPVRGYFSADAVKRALENLVVNAVKYGSAEAPIRVELRSEYERALLSVHNEGPPIPSEDQALLFQPFYRSAGTERRRGWGLGLALVRGVAEAHGGSVIVDSAPGRGTTFTMDMPLDARPFQTATSE